MREAAQRGGPLTPAAHRFPTEMEHKAYRGDAERRLQTFAAIAIEQEEQRIADAGVGLAVNSAKIEIIERLNRRTSFWSVIGTNLVAWVITLALTIVLIGTIYLPNWQADLVERLRAAQAPAAVTVHP